MGEQLLKLIESLKAEEASIGRLFGGEGTPVRTGRRGPDPAWAAKVAEAAGFMAEVMDGHRPFYHLQEAMTTSDFPNLFGDIVDRMMLGSYRETPVTYRAYAKISEVRDFRTVRRFTLTGAEARLAKVREQEEYPEAALTDAKYEYKVEKFGRRLPFSWESHINEDLGAFRDIPTRMGRSGRRTEEHFATTLFVDANGPHASLYTSGNKNIVNVANGAATNNPALSTPALADAMKVLARQVDADGEPIFIETVHLVVPPALEITATQIANAVQIELTEAGGTAAQKLIAANWMKNRVQIHVNYMIPVVASTANGHTSWFLFADPNNGTPAIEVGFLRGRQEPETFIKEPNARRVGGGPIDPLDGDFDTDSIEYKVRHVLGGTREEPKSTVASNGSGA